MVLYLIDEITAIKDEQNFDHALDRTARTGGQVFIASTPIQNHWARGRFVTAGNEHVGLYAFTGEDNVWFKREDFWRWVESKGGRRDIEPNEQPPYVQRECFGIWSIDGAPAFPSWDPGLLSIVQDTRDLADLGFDDITEQATRTHFGAPSPLLIGQDFNDRSHTATIGKVGVKRGQDPSNWQNWHFFTFDVFQTSEFIEDHAISLAARS